MTLGLLWNRILFEEACTTAIAAVQHMPQLRVLHLEPTAEDSLVPEDLFTLGKHLQELCVLGERAPPLNSCPCSTYLPSSEAVHLDCPASRTPPC